MATKQQQTDKLQAEMLEQDICPELRAQAIQLVMGDGNLDAEIVFIGEAPGKKEDELGVPFVGASGKFLNEMLAAADMEREDVYITNIVKYRPSNNRDPSPEEKEAFWPYLLQQLEIIQPKVIVTLGRHSGGYFIPDLHISADHGKPHKVVLHGHEYLVVPLYHPAAALYNGSMRTVLVEDFLQMQQLLRKTR